MSRRQGVCLLAVALALAGCGGGPLGRHAFEQDVESIQSLAAEGALVADQVAGGNATQTFVRVHTRYLGRAAGSLRRKLAAARVAPSLARKRRQAVLIAATVDQDLELLRRHPGDRQLGRRLGDELERAAKQAEELAG
jgi:hypothetical protein